MRLRALLRPSVAAAGQYFGTVFGFLATVAATRLLVPKEEFGRFALVLAAASFIQVLLDSAAEEAAVKYGFRYAAREEWGKLRRLFRVALGAKLASAAVAGLLLAVMAPLADRIFSTSGLAAPLLVAAVLPLVQAPESLAGAALVLRRRYDVRSAFHGLSMALRLGGVLIGAQYGVAQALAGIVVGQVVATAAISLAAALVLSRFPAAQPAPLGDDRPELLRFVGQSAVASTLLASRSTLPALLVGVVAPAGQVADFRAAQAPQTGFAAASGPARLFLLTEQTHDVEHGRLDRVWTMLRTYMLTTAALMAVAVPPLWIWMDDVLSFLYGARYASAADPARLILLAAAIQLVWGWSKTLPVSIGRPGLRLLANGLEIATLVPLVLLLADRNGAEGAAVAVLASTIVLAGVWTLLLVRLRGVLVSPSEMRPANP
jgi:O-antigen/teichoic acid export membrane protein